MTKIIVNAEGVQALLKLDPEATAELAKNASAQVAQAIMHKINKFQINEVIDKKFQESLAIFQFRIFPQEAKNKINNEARKAVLGTITELAEQTVRIQLNKAVAEAMEKVQSELDRRVQTLVKDALRSALK